MMRTVKKFHRYATVQGHRCKRLGHFTFVWTENAYYTYCTVASELGHSLQKGVPYSRRLTDKDVLLSTTKQYLDFRTPPIRVMEDIANGDVADCQGCTFCQRFIFRCDEPGIQYTGIYNGIRQRIEGKVSMFCLNPGAFLQDEIKWRGRFKAYCDPSGCVYMELTYLNIPHPHRFSDYSMCLNHRIMDMARTLFHNGEYASGLRIMLEAARTITPYDIANFDLQHKLGIWRCDQCRTMHSAEDENACSVCGIRLCHDCMDIAEPIPICKRCYDYALYTHSTITDFTWTQDGVPQIPLTGTGDVGIGSIVLLGMHDNRDYWNETMDKYVGQMAIITHTGLQCSPGYPVVKVNVDKGRFNWRIKNMYLGHPKEHMHQTIIDQIVQQKEKK